MLLEVADSSMTYRSRYFTILQPAPVLDLLMNEEANPRSLAFQVKDLFEHCRSLSSMPSGAGWPIVKQETSGGSGIQSVSRGCPQALRTGRRAAPASDSMNFSPRLDAALPALSNAITHAYFSHAETERTSMIYRVRHRTTYDYEDPVSVSHHLVRLTPRNLPGQICT